MNNNPIPIDEDGLFLATGRTAVRSVLRQAGAELLVADRGARAILARATGLAMTGKRVSVILEGQALDEALPGLVDAVKRGIPMVIHLICDCHAAYHRLAETGAFAVFARDAQQAVDLTLVAHNVSELALVPAIVAQDGPETADAPQSLRLPDKQLIARLLGDMGSEVQPPSPAQDFLFGRTRARIPRWFDPDHAVASGWTMTSADRAAALAGRRLFYADHLEAIARHCMDLVATATGRPLAFFSNDHISHARVVLVAQGAALAVAEATAADLRTSHGWKAGVLGLTSLRPLSSKDIRKCLEKARVVAVLECPAGAIAEGPLYRELVTLAPPTALVYPAWRDAGLNLSASQIAALFRTAREGAGDRAFLGLNATAATSTYPKQEMVFQTLRRDYPQLDQSVLSGGEPVDTAPQDAIRLVLFGEKNVLTDSALLAVAEGLSQRSGRCLRSAVRTVGAGLKVATLTSCVASFEDPGAGDPAEMVLVTRLDLPFNPALRLKPGGRLVIASLEDAETIAALVPDSWRSLLVRRGGKAVLFAGTAAELIAAAPALAFSDELFVLPLDQVPLVDPGTGAPPSLLPETRSQQDYGSLPRFWGEVLQPRVADAFGPVPDPRLSLGCLPSGSAAITNRTRDRVTNPVFKPSACSGCGSCWLACPDSALGAMAVTIEQLLDTASEGVAVGANREIFGKLKRAHKNLASRLVTIFTKSGSRVLSQEHLTEAFEWLLARMKVDENEIANFKTLFDATCLQLLQQQVALTPNLFHQPQAVSKGTGVPLVLAFDPTRCQGCGLCADVCPDEALVMEPRVLHKWEERVGHWREFQALPDTNGAVIDRLRYSLGPLAANFLSRACAQALPGGDDAEPGSGIRLALHLLCGSTEYRAQREVVQYAAELKDLVDSLTRRVKQLVAEAVPVKDLAVLEQALGGMPAHRAALKDVVGELDNLGSKSALDGRRVAGLAALAREMQELHDRLTRGRSGAGRARYGLVLAASSVDEMTHYPNNPFMAPVVADAGGQGPELALGLLDGMISDHLEETTRVRLAQAALKLGPEAAEQEVSADLDWSQLTLAEQSRCPLVLLVLDSQALAGAELVGLAKALDCGYPIKVLVLDDFCQPCRGFDPLTQALAHPQSFVLSSSLARPKHLGPLLEQALAFKGPALLHIYAPAPRKHGFASDQTLALAGKAVAAGIQPLFAYDPERGDHFGARLILEAEPLAPDGLNAWLSAQSRFMNGGMVDSPDQIAQARDQRLATLRELCGLDSPFIERIRADLEAEMETTYLARQARLADGFRSELERMDHERREALSIQLSQRLLDLANRADLGGGV